MHGSPLSKWDSRAIWEKYDYRALGITAEPYFDIDFNKDLVQQALVRQLSNRRLGMISHTNVAVTVAHVVPLHCW